jgi:hypothetical protein
VRQKTALQPDLDDDHQVTDRRRVVERVDGEVAVTGAEPVEPQDDQHDVERSQPELVEVVGVLIDASSMCNRAATRR